MRIIGFDKPLYILPFDHRGSFQTKMFGWKGTLTSDQTAQIAATKQVIYDAFVSSLESGVPRDKAGILVDEQFGAAILRNALAHGYSTACPAEKSGQDEFDFEYGDDFGKHIELFRPTFCKVLVRYNPEGDRALNTRQASRLKRLSDYLHEKSESRFIFELLVPAETEQLNRLKADKKRYDVELRPRLMVETIEELQDAGVEPDIWKIEGLDRHEDCKNVVAAARRGAALGSLDRPQDVSLPHRLLARWLVAKSAVSSWAAARTITKFTSGWQLRARFPDSSASPSAALVSGNRSCAGEQIKSRGSRR